MCGFERPHDRDDQHVLRVEAEFEPSGRQPATFKRFAARPQRDTETAQVREKQLPPECVEHHMDHTSPVTALSENHSAIADINPAPVQIVVRAHRAYAQPAAVKQATDVDATV